MSKHDNPILVSTKTLSTLADRINEKLAGDALSKPVLLNIIAGTIAGTKHNWGYLTSATKPVTAQGVEWPDITDEMNGWRPIAELPENAGEILLIARYPNSTKTWSDVYHGWQLPDGHFARWTHPFAPQFWKPIAPPKMAATINPAQSHIPYLDEVESAFHMIAQNSTDITDLMDEGTVTAEQVDIAVKIASHRWIHRQGPQSIFVEEVRKNGTLYAITDMIIDYEEGLLMDFLTPSENETRS